MADERYSFSQARTRLEEIVTQVRKKDTSLEKSLDLLEEGVRLANVCTEQSDHTEWRSVVKEQESEQESDSANSPEAEVDGADESAGDVDVQTADAADLEGVATDADVEVATDDAADADPEPGDEPEPSADEASEAGEPGEDPSSHPADA